MKENKDQRSKVSTCFEETPAAEMMRKITGEQGIGSLCEQMMRTWMKSRRDVKGEPQGDGRGEGAGREAGGERRDRPRPESDSDHD